MCDGSSHEHQGSIQLATQPGIPFGKRVRMIAVNLGRRMRGGTLHDCCGRFGEPGC
jgi:hypothetical protein